MKRPRTDANAPELVQTLRRMGVSCEFGIGGYRNGFPDVVCGYQGTTHLLEIKVLGKHLGPDQVQFSARHNGCFHVATNAWEAFNLILECHSRRREPNVGPFR